MIGPTFRLHRVSFILNILAVMMLSPKVTKYFTICFRHLEKLSRCVDAKRKNTVLCKGLVLPLISLFQGDRLPCYFLKWN